MCDAQYIRVSYLPTNPNNVEVLNNFYHMGKNSKRSADRRAGPAGQKPGAQHKTGRGWRERAAALRTSWGLEN